jgi:hypothetical protein
LNEDVKNEELKYEQSHEALRVYHTHPKPQNLPYLEILNQEKYATQPMFDFMGEVKKMCGKIILFQVIKYVPIYLKVV